MQAEQEGDRKAQKLLRRLPGRHPQVPLAKQPGNRQRAVDGEAADQQHHARRATPDAGEDAPPGLHCFHRREAETVVQQMACHIGEQDNAAP